MPDFLIYEQDGPVVTLTMNQPERRNPLTGNTAIPEFLAAIDRINDDQRVRCVILTGNGPSFSSGGDLAVMQRQGSDEMTEMEVRQDYRRGVQRMARRLWDLEVPVIAAINGHAIGAGLDLSCMCDVRIASEQAKFAVSFIKVGIVPGDGVADLCTELRPVLSLHARVSRVQRLAAGEGVSYGHRAITAAPTTVATLPIGYADGVPRRLWSQGGEVLIGGKRCPIIGVVTMDQMMVDCGDMEIDVGDEAVLLGSQGSDAIRAEDWASALDTIGYEITCGIGSRVPRVYTRSV